MKCIINLNDLKHTQSGKIKKWSTDGILTYCCESQPSYFVWEKDTKYNGYNGYSGYIHCEYVKLIQKIGRK